MRWKWHWLTAGAVLAAALVIACNSNDTVSQGRDPVGPAPTGEPSTMLAGLRQQLVGGIDSQRKAAALRGCLQIADQLAVRADPQAGELTNVCKSIEAADPNTSAAWDAIRQRVDELAVASAQSSGSPPGTPTATRAPATATPSAATGSTGAPSALPPTGQNRPPGTVGPQTQPRNAEVTIADDRVGPQQLDLEANVATTLRVNNRSGSTCSFFVGDLLTKLQVPAGESRDISFQATVSATNTAATSASRVVDMGCEGDSRRQGKAVIEFRGVLPGPGQN